jgi:sugar phosphate isomerase/epimerase
MELGISSYTFPWNIGVAGYEPPQRMSAFDLLDYAVALGVSRVQYGDNLPLHLLSSSELAKLSEEAQSRSITIEVGARGLTSPNMMRYLEIAKQLASPFLRAVIDDNDYHPSIDDVVQVIKSILPAFKQNGMIVAIENHDRFPSLTLRSIIEHTDLQFVAICLDTANSFGAVEGSYETVRLLAPNTINLHIKDISITRVPNKMGFHISGTAAGEGILDLPRIIEKVRKGGRCISATLEIWSDFETDIHVTTSAEKQMAEQSIHYLKQYFI